MDIAHELRELVNEYNYSLGSAARCFAVHIQESPVNSTLGQSAWHRHILKRKMDGMTCWHGYRSVYSFRCHAVEIDGESNVVKAGSWADVSQSHASLSVALPDVEVG